MYDVCVCGRERDRAVKCVFICEKSSNINKTKEINYLDPKILTNTHTHTYNDLMMMMTMMTHDLVSGFNLMKHKMNFSAFDFHSNNK